MGQSLQGSSPQMWEPCRCSGPRGVLGWLSGAAVAACQQKGMFFSSILKAAWKSGSRSHESPPPAHVGLGHSQHPPVPTATRRLLAMEQPQHNKPVGPVPRQQTCIHSACLMRIFQLCPAGKAEGNHLSEAASRSGLCLPVALTPPPSLFSFPVLPPFISSH